MADDKTVLFDRKTAAARWKVALDEVERALSENVVVAFLGSASSGKDAAIRALFGVDFGQVDPVPGSTDRVRVALLDPGRRVVLVNAPGFGDLRAEVEAAARKLVDRMDVAVYVLSCEGGATADEKANIDSLCATGRPFLVCLNKIDLVRPHQRTELVRDTLARLGIDRSQDMPGVAVTAFDPLPALADAPIGLETVVTWLMKTLREQGKDLLLARRLRDRAMACEPIIRSAARKAALAGAVPVVGLDMTAVTAVQVRLITDIAAVYGVKVSRDLTLFILGEALAGAGRGFARWAVDALKGAGWIPGGQIAEAAASALGASIASASTYGVGRAALAYMQRTARGAAMSAAELGEIYEISAAAWREE